MKLYPMKEDCDADFTEPVTWIVHLIEICLALLALALNCVLTVMTHHAHTIPQAQRRFLASMSLNFSMLAGFQLSRNIFLLIALYHPCLNLMNSISCKLQEFPLLFCYIHGALIAFIVAAQTNATYKTRRSDKNFSSLCSVWQSALMVVAIGITLVFTAFDHDPVAKSMNKCSILLALRKTELAYLLLTVLICGHAASVLLLALSTSSPMPERDRSVLLSISLKDVMNIETMMWQGAMLISGCCLLYRHIMLEYCYECIQFILEISFVIFPLVISFIHPILSIWYVLPLRDVIVQTFPCLGAVLPEYALVPPPPVRQQSSTCSKAQPATTSCVEMTDRNPKKTDVPKMAVIVDSDIDNL